MKTSEPPHLSTWLLERFAPRHKRESLMGDLREQYHEGRSAMWYRRQVFGTILAGVAADIIAHKLHAVRALAFCWLVTSLLSQFLGWLRPQLFVRWGTSLWGESDLLRQFWAWYSVPFFVLLCLGCFATGWMIARMHRRHSAGMVILCAVSLLLPASLWGWRTWRLLQAGLWPYWDYRLALMFQAAVLFVACPVCVLLGGLWATSSDHDAASRVSLS